MSWNFNYTIPSLIVLSFFMIYYFIKPSILVKSNKYFLALVLIEILGFCSDIVSSYSDINAQCFYRSFIVFVDTFYFVLFIIRHYIISLFFASIVKVHIKKDIPSVITTIVSIGIIILILINPWTEWFYIINDEGKYIRGPYYRLIYYAAFFTLGLNLYYLIRYSARLELSEMLSAIFSILSLLLGSVLKILFPHYVIIDMFFIFVIISLFLAFQNPEIYKERKTNLYNQQGFNDLVKEYFFNNNQIAIISFYIKNYNEKREIYGTKQMDYALKEIGKYLKNTFPTKKLFYLRSGRFAIVDNSSKDFTYIRKTVLARFRQPWVTHNANLHLSIAVIDTGTDVKFYAVQDIYACFRIAFENMNKSLRNHITIDNEVFKQIAYTTKVSKALNKALTTDNLQLYLQPIVDAKSRKIIAAEALVRIQDEDLGLIPPDEFIRMAEKNGSIEQLGDQILNKVCIFIKENNLTKYGIKWINVNLSPIQCQNNRLCEKIDSIVNGHAINHANIHLEITEESMIDGQILKRQMNTLIEDGYNFSLDDFGTGFSNITRMKTFPFNNIKLDMSIVWEHFKTPDNILPSFVQAFIERGQTVTAEGVETKEMADALQKMGCEYLQGYYFSKPVPCNDFLKLLKPIN